jgi:putative membrane protein
MPAGSLALSASLTLSDWSVEPSVLGGLALMVVAYVILTARAGARAQRTHRGGAAGHPVWFALGIAGLFVALQSPVDVGGDRYLFSLHMLQHIVLAVVAPPLLLLGVAGALPARPVGVLRPLVNPWVAAAVFNAVLLVWHLPMLYEATLRVQPLHILEHATFFLTGLCFWWPVIEPGGALGMTWLGRIAYLTLTNIPPTVLGLLFAVAPTAYYPFYLEAPRLWGLTPVEDQQLAGLVMFGLGGLVYVAAMAALFVGFARADHGTPSPS